MTKYDELRIAAGKVEALATAVEEIFDSTIFDGKVDRQRLEHTAVLIGLCREAAEHALNAVDAFNADALNPAIPDSDPSTRDEPK